LLLRPEIGALTTVQLRSICDCLTAALAESTAAFEALRDASALSKSFLLTAFLEYSEEILSNSIFARLA